VIIDVAKMPYAIIKLSSLSVFGKNTGAIIGARKT
jgi:hypothetical protein